MILSHYQVKPILAAKQTEQTAVTTSLDLGLTTAELPLTAEGVQLPDGQQLNWAQLEEIMANENSCYQIRNNQIDKVTFFSEALQRAYSLFPTHSAPTMLVSGITMHRIVDCDPHQDTLNKIKAAGKIYGDVLDTTMGLGYTAIQAAKTAASARRELADSQFLGQKIKRSILFASPRRPVKIRPRPVFRGPSGPTSTATTPP